MISEIKEKLKNRRIPFIPFLYPITWHLNLPKVDLSKENQRFHLFVLFTFFAATFFAGVFSYMDITPPLLEAKNVTSGIAQRGYEQTLFEGFVSAGLFLSGVFGSFILKMATHFATERYKARIYFYGGVILLIVAILGLMLMLGRKNV